MELKTKWYLLEHADRQCRLIENIKKIKLEELTKENTKLFRWYMNCNNPQLKMELEKELIILENEIQKFNTRS